MKERQADFAQYLPAKSKPIEKQTKELQQDMQKLKELLRRFEEDQTESEQAVRNHKQKASHNEALLLRACEAKVEEAYEVRVSGLEQEKFVSSTAIEDIYRHQIQLSSCIQEYINSLSKQNLKLHIHLETRGHQSLGNTNLKQDLPPVSTLHSQVLEQVQICQQGFNKMMEEVQQKLEKQIQTLAQAENKMVEELRMALDSRITFLQDRSGFGLCGQ